MKQERTLKQIQVTLQNVENQCRYVLDFMEQLVKDCPEYDTCHKLMNYIALAIYDIDEKKLKHCRRFETCLQSCVLSFFPLCYWVRY